LVGVLRDHYCFFFWSQNKAFPYCALISLEGWCESKHVGRRKYSNLGAKSCIVAVPRNRRQHMEPALQNRMPGTEMAPGTTTALPPPHHFWTSPSQIHTSVPPQQPQ